MTTGALNTQTTPAYYEPQAAVSDPTQHQLRILIDEAATLRGLTIQMSMRLMALAAADTDAQRAQVRDEFRVLLSQFHVNMDLLFGTGTPQGAQREHILWIRAIVARNTERRVTLLEAMRRFDDLSDQLDTGHVPDFEAARQVFDQNWPVIRDKITEVIWDLWADLDAQKADAIGENAALKSTLKHTLSDIRQFSAAIRMIAINTAVLATRPDEAGAGFKLIAKEVKQLSEDIDQSTGRATDALSGLM